MPYIAVKTNQDLPENVQQKILAELSLKASQETGKPEQYVMTSIEQTAINMSGKNKPAAFVDVRSIGGLTPETNTHLSLQICSVLKEHAGILPDSVYINFANIQRHDWGWDNKTF